jgi:hypothetical protein
MSPKTGVRREKIERAILKTLTRREDWFSTGSPLNRI